MSRFISDFGNFTANLLQTHGRITKAVNDQLEREARMVMEIAKQMVPREFGAMESAIKVDSARQRRTWIIYVDDSVRRDLRKKKPGTVGDYLEELHDAGPDWRPGVESRNKQKTTRYRVGPKFMERALEAHLRTRALQRIEAAARNAMRRL